MRLVCAYPPFCGRRRREESNGITEEGAHTLNEVLRELRCSKAHVSKATEGRVEPGLGELRVGGITWAIRRLRVPAVLLAQVQTLEGGQSREPALGSSESNSTVQMLLMSAPRDLGSFRKR